MKTQATCVIAAVLFIPFAGLWEGAPSLRVGKPAEGISFINQFVPDSLDLADLDVRDDRNRAIRSAESSQLIESLFNQSLYELTVLAAPHNDGASRDGLELFSRLFVGLILSCFPRELPAFEEAILPSVRRFVHNVHNLWITFSVGLFACLLLAPRFSPERAASRLNLRC